MSLGRKSGSFVCATGLLCAVLSAPGHADSATPAPIAIEAQALDIALHAFALQTGLQLAYVTDLTRGKRTRGCAATAKPAEALAQLLEGTGLTFEFLNERTVQIRAEARDGLRKMAFRSSGSPRKDGTARVADAAPDIQEVVVTSRKRDERLFDVPMSVTVVTGESMEWRGANALSEVLPDAPSLSVIDPGSGMQHLNIRGVSTLLGSNEIGFYLDELPFTGVTVPLEPDVRTWDIERVEVLRGPQGTLFGEGSLGGTVRTLTRGPQFDTWETMVSVQGSDIAGGEFSRATRALLNVPLVEDRLALRLAGTQEHIAGWADDVTRDEPHANSRDITTWRGKLQWRPADALTVNASYWYYDGKYSRDNVTTEDLTLPSASALTGRMTYRLGGLSATYDFGPVSAFYSIAHNTVDYPQEGLDPASRITANLDFRVTSQELRFSSRGPATFDWTVGYYDREVHRNDLILLEAISLENRSRTNGRSEALFGETTYHLSGIPVDLSAGVRIVRETVNSLETSVGGPAYAMSVTYPSASPRFIVAWHPSEALRLYTSAAKGYRSGQIQTGLARTVAESQGIDLPATLKDDSIWTYELGAKTTLDERLSLDMAVYRSVWNHPPVRAPLGTTGFNSMINSGGTRANGVEVTLRTAISRAWSFAISGSYTDAVYASDVPGTGIVRGSTVDYVAKTVANAALEWQEPLFAAMNGIGRLGVQYNSPRSFTSLGSLALPGDAITTVAARLGAQGRYWGAFLFANNLTDEHGAVGPRGFSGPETIAVRLQPRTVGLELTLSLQ